MTFDIHKKEQEGQLYENSAGKKIVSLKLWTFFWGHGEHEWLSVYSHSLHNNIKDYINKIVCRVCYINTINGLC